MKGLDLVQKAYHKKAELRKTFLDIDESRFQLMKRKKWLDSEQALLRFAGL